MKKQEKKHTASPSKSKAGIVNRFENWLQKKDKVVLYALMGVCTLFCFLMFSARITEMHDDALYIEAGWRFVNEFPDYFYTANAPLYTLWLALLIKLFGLKIILMKVCNIIFMILGLFLFHKAFNNRIPKVVLFPVLVFLSINHSLLFFASQTFTEHFYLVLQAIFFIVFFKLSDKLDAGISSLKETWKNWLLLGLLMALLAFTKNIANVSVVVVVLFFLLKKNWKAIGLAIASFMIFYLPVNSVFNTFKSNMFAKMGVAKSASQFSNQSRLMFLKNPYDASEGEEDLSGFVTRFLENCDLYLSKRFFQIIGFTSENSVNVYGTLTFLVIILVAAGLWFAFRRKNQYLLLSGLYTAAIIAGTFVALQTRWDQPRMILINMPVMFLLFYFFLYELFKNKAGFGQVLYMLIMILISGSMLLSSLKRISENLPGLKQNLKGNIYYGYTPDWVNFAKASKWCADSLPPESFVASRKAPDSFIFSEGKRFYPIYSVIAKDSVTNQSNPDSVLAIFKRNKVTHVIIASLRIDPKKNTGQVINTMHNIIQPLAKKYPERLKLVHTEGESEQAQVFEIIQK